MSEDVIGKDSPKILINGNGIWYDGCAHQDKRQKPNRIDEQKSL